MKTTTINIGDTVRIIEIHPRDEHYNADYVKPGYIGIFTERGMNSEPGYLSGGIKYTNHKGSNYFYAIKVEKVEADPKPAPQPGDNSQNGRILKHLRSGASINPMQALELFGCFRLASRIWDLTQAGYDIDSMPGYNPRTKKRFSVYFLKETT